LRSLCLPTQGRLLDLQQRITFESHSAMPSVGICERQPRQPERGKKANYSPDARARHFSKLLRQAAISFSGFAFRQHHISSDRNLRLDNRLGVVIDVICFYFRTVVVDSSWEISPLHTPPTLQGSLARCTQLHRLYFEEANG
jgi:hypothetical protein